MAAAYQCDRCKKFFAEKDVDGSAYPYIVNIGATKTERTLDLCPSCKEKLVAFISVKEQTN
jgi:hypothetical protein